jgi:hypothetical protein
MTNTHTIQTTRTSVSARRRGKCKRRESPLCVYADFGPRLPTPTTRRKILDLSASGYFPKFCRPAGPRSEPVFSKKDVLDWYRQNFGDLWPDLVDQVERDFALKSHPNDGAV